MGNVRSGYMSSGTAVVEKAPPGCTADQGGDQPPPPGAGKTGGVLFPPGLYQCPTHPTAPVHPAANPLARLQESDATRRGTGDRRHYRGVETVRVDRQVVVAAVGNALEHRVHADVVQLVRGDQLRAPRLCDAEFLRPAAALRAQAD